MLMPFLCCLQLLLIPSSSWFDSDIPSAAVYRLLTKWKAFFFREDVARTLPNKRYATKAGAGRLMLMTLQEAFMLFKGTPETCACMYCLNVRLKNEVLNKILSTNLESFRMPGETKMLDLLLCQKLDNQRWHHHLCLNGKCQSCDDPERVIQSKFEPYMDEPTSWQHWERISVDGRTRLELLSKSGKLRDLLTEFVEKDLKQPAQGTTFVRHLHTFFWQFNQYADLKTSLQTNEAIMVMDFAENRKASYTVEVKSAHFGKAQITMHPIVCFYMAGDVMKRHSMVFLSDDICHDYHAVHHFTVDSIDALSKAAPSVEKIYIFSDGCAGQYKGKGTFADLSLYTGKRIQRVFFGSEHGKGEADGETGVINCAVDRAVSSGRLTVRNASDLYSWCSEKLTKSDASSLRDFFLVPKEKIVRDRPQTDVVTVPGTRRIHQAERVSDYIIRTRNLACFCEVCRADGASCLNESYVGEYTTHKLKHR
ncbi:(S)-beta-bisabolene synthase [Elysia marginata]|uniref:(S)-beta-bisabolene synthase n=1 Tax=Elysia marginata TaxID=1093978 RepID=A0AAV4IXF9_9GAST|nr:(S)-beta-bisabolene synthase [Elysia marginata]